MAEAVNDFVVLQAPARNGEKGGGGLGDEAFEHEVGSETFDEVDDEVDVFVGSEEMEVGGILLVFLCHSSATNELELVKLERGEGKGRQDVGFGKDGFPTLPWKTENEMSPCADATSRCTPNGIDGLGVSVTAIDALESGIIDGFDAIFDKEEGAVVEFRKVIQRGIGHAVGTGSDDQPHHIGNGERLLVLGFQVVECIVGVGVCLKVCQILHVGIFARKELLALLQLLGDGFGGDAIVGVEGLIVAIGATACAHPSVAIGTGETCVEGDFLHLHSQLIFEPNSVFVV